MGDKIRGVGRRPREDGVCVIMEPKINVIRQEPFLFFTSKKIKLTNSGSLLVVLIVSEKAI